MPRCGPTTGCTCAIEAGPGIEVTGNGSNANAYVISGENPGTGSSTSCTAIMTCWASNIVAPLAYDPKANRATVKVSADAGNILDVGTDGGLFVPPQDPYQPAYGRWAVSSLNPIPTNGYQTPGLVESWATPGQFSLVNGILRTVRPGIYLCTTQVEFGGVPAVSAGMYGAFYSTWSDTISMASLVFAQAGAQLGTYIGWAQGNGSTGRGTFSVQRVGPLPPTPAGAPVNSPVPTGPAGLGG